MEEVGLFHNAEHEGSSVCDGTPNKNTGNSVMQIGNIYGSTSQAGRVYSIKGLCPTLGTMQGGAANTTNKGEI